MFVDCSPNLFVVVKLCLMKDACDLQPTCSPIKLVNTLVEYDNNALTA